MFKKYYYLAKPGIIRGNAIVAVAGFLYGSKENIDVWLLGAMLLGTSLVMASACVFNNYIDRDIDLKMSRTKSRALPSGQISTQSALLYATVLGIGGFSILIAYTNNLTAVIGLIAYIDYIALYGLAKRHTTHSTLVGTIAGASPPVAGYTAATGQLDISAFLLFLILVFWQMPHFYAIGVRRLSDYKKAGWPILPVVKGVERTKIEILIYTAGFIVATLCLSIFSYASYMYAVAMSLIGLFWFYLAIVGFKTKDETAWARGFFLFSLVVLLSFSIMISINTYLP